jgi:hypothetical protein
MKAGLGVIVLFVAGACHAAQTYKWVDEKGVTNYGEKPPESSGAVPVDTEPQGPVGTGDEAAQRAEADRRARADRRPLEVVPVPVPPSYTRAEPVRGMSFDTFVRLERGMTEGELLIRAGPPDHRTLDSAEDVLVKTYYYFPTVSDPFTTVVTLRGGRIARLERIRKF